MDPYSILGIREGVPPREVAAAYREQAKRWHPDRGGGAQAERRMAEINAAYDLLRAAASAAAAAGGAGCPTTSAVRSVLSSSTH